MSSSVLITGGAGYIGSHIVYELLDHGYRDLVVVDDLSASRTGLLPPEVDFYQQTILDTDGLIAVIKKHDVKTIIHMAAFLKVEESVRAPLKYYQNNVDGTRSVLAACMAGDVRKLIFSSTGAVYASSEKKLTEAARLEPASPYGHSKLMAEQVIRDGVASSHLQAVILRYFNVPGADPKGRTGQQGTSGTHLIANACQAAAGDMPQFNLFGTDYDTADGTCIRDYIHVSDLAAIHRLVLEQDFAARCPVFNCGYGAGFSVRQVIERFKSVTGTDFPVLTAPRRPGDLAQIVADPAALMAQTGWQPTYHDLDLIIRTAWDWYRRERAR